MSMLDGFIDKVANIGDQQFQSVDNMLHMNGGDKAFSLGMQALNIIDPQAAKTVDALLGAGRVMLDQNGDGAIQFGEIAPVAKGIANLIGL
jgi:hypothetical protein